MPDALRVKYETIQNNQLELFQRTLICQKIETLTEQVNELKAIGGEERAGCREPLESHPAKLRLTDQSIKEKKTFLLESFF